VRQVTRKAIRIGRSVRPEDVQAHVHRDDFADVLARVRHAVDAGGTSNAEYRTDGWWNGATRTWTPASTGCRCRWPTLPGGSRPCAAASASRHVMGDQVVAAALVGEVGYVSRDWPNLFLPDRMWLATARSESTVDMKWLGYLLSSSYYSGRMRGASCPTELGRQTYEPVKCLERVTGIEPAWPAWKAGALPLSYTREVL
jgi:hypothetical protein